MMAQEEKQLLLKDLCARLPYGVKVQFHLPNYNTNCFDDKIGEVFEIGTVFTHVHCDGIDYLPNTNRIKPYLRPMSSMTEEDVKEIRKINWQFCKPKNDSDECFVGDADDGYCSVSQMARIINYLNTHHFDYNGLIQMGLALEAPEGMYEIE